MSGNCSAPLISLKLLTGLDMLPFDPTPKYCNILIWTLPRPMPVGSSAQEPVDHCENQDSAAVAGGHLHVTYLTHAHDYI